MKVDATELYLISEMSIREVANQLGINNSPLISRWLHEYPEKGIEGLSGKTGRPSMNKVEDNALEETKAAELNNEFTPSHSVHIKDLECKICALKIEYAYLKELRRLWNAQKPKSNEHISKIIHYLREAYPLNDTRSVEIP